MPEKLGKSISKHKKITGAEAERIIKETLARVVREPEFQKKVSCILNMSKEELVKSTLISLGVITEEEIGLVEETLDKKKKGDKNRQG